MLIYSTPPNVIAFTTTRSGKISLDICKIVIPYHQAHGTKTVIIDNDFLSKNPLEQAIALMDVDALSTNISNICVCVKTADCVPILLWDETTHVVSSVHAGWKGTIKHVIEININKLHATYGTLPQNIHAIIGPCIDFESFEVGDELYEAFAQEGFPMNKLAIRTPSMHANNSQMKWHIDLVEGNRIQLVNQGVNPNNIYISNIDTYKKFHEFYSARRNAKGRNFNGIMIKE